MCLRTLEQFDHLARNPDVVDRIIQHTNKECAKWAAFDESEDRIYDDPDSAMDAQVLQEDAYLAAAHSCVARVYDGTAVAETIVAAEVPSGDVSMASWHMNEDTAPLEMNDIAEALCALDFECDSDVESSEDEDDSSDDDEENS